MRLLDSSSWNDESTDYYASFPKRNFGDFCYADITPPC